MSERQFHLGDILSITHDRLVSPRHMDGVYDICNFLTADNLFTHQLPRVYGECKAHLLALHPELNALPMVSDEDAAKRQAVNGQWWEQWLSEAVARFGESLAVTPIPDGIHEYVNPIREAVDIFGRERVIVIEPDQEQS